jgi:hypothetical protein
LIKKQETNENLKLQILKGLEAQEGEHATSLIDAALHPRKTKLQQSTQRKLIAPSSSSVKIDFTRATKRRKRKASHIFLSFVFSYQQKHTTVCVRARLRYGEDAPLTYVIASSLQLGRYMSLTCERYENRLYLLGTYVSLT